MSAKLFQILSREQGSPDGEMAPIAARAQLLDDLARHNTAAESEQQPDLLYGPGIRIELTPGEDPVKQMLLYITDEDIAWDVMIRLARQFKWRIHNPTGSQPDLEP
ncbi:MAG: hypothetical protein CMJ32_08425 [Phycisphaerae bacterium]|nr:hypothetical protein [Phycisphaerae bacterium]